MAGDWFQDAGGHSGLPPLPHSDLAVLSTAAGALFERTADMSDEAVVTLLGALHLVSAASLPAAAQQPGNTKCARPLTLHLVCFPTSVRSASFSAFVLTVFFLVCLIVRDSLQSDSLALTRYNDSKLCTLPDIVNSHLGLTVADGWVRPQAVRVGAHGAGAAREHAPHLRPLGHLPVPRARGEALFNCVCTLQH